MGVDTLIAVSLVMLGSLGEEDLAPCSSLGAIALVGTPVVVELQVAIEGGLHRGRAGEEPPAELDAPQFAEEVPCSRSTKPLIQACRGLVRVWRMLLSAQTLSKTPRYS